MSKDGPYLVSGNVPLTIQIITPNEEGLSWDWKQRKTIETKEEYNLCRCGRSKTNRSAIIRARKSDSMEQRQLLDAYVRRVEVFDGPTLTLSDAEDLCAFARFCDPGGKIWSLMEQTDDPEVRKLVIREATNVRQAGSSFTTRKLAQRLNTSFQPRSVWSNTGARLQWAAMDPWWNNHRISRWHPSRGENKMTLCRCGMSVNKPFCNGSHASIKFKDGLVEFASQKHGE